MKKLDFQALVRQLDALWCDRAIQGRQSLDRFHRVATHYLPNYLGWRWAADAHRISAPLDLLKTSVGVFPHLAAT
ncbi:hypothetical protein RugamoR57_26630 [Duganella caerulea]